MTEKPRPWWKQAPPRAEPAPLPNDLADGETREVQGSGAQPYVLKNSGGVYSCTCPSWMHQGAPTPKRTCKHLKALRGEDAEIARVGSATSTPLRSTTPGVAPPILLAHPWDTEVDLTGWWLSEKLDGVRAYWDGKQLLSRQGNAFVAPEWFIAALPPDTILDGELFGGRKQFQKTVSVVRRQDASDAWRGISYVLFDAPAHPGLFEERIAAVEQHVTRASVEHVKAHPHVECRGVTHLKEELARVEALGGEGLMVRRPGSRYESGRSHTLLKVKSFHDAEARVIAHVAGLGKHQGRLGALTCELPNGTRFNVGTGFSDEERGNPPAVGSVITFRYQELSEDGVPRFPSYVGQRIDGQWPASPPPTGPLVTSASPETRSFVQGGLIWRIRLAGASHVIETIRGSMVDSVTTSFLTAAAAWRDADHRIAMQRSAGFVEQMAD